MSCSGVVRSAGTAGGAPGTGSREAPHHGGLRTREGQRAVSGAVRMPSTTSVGTSCRGRPMYPYDDTIRLS